MMQRPYYAYAIAASLCLLASQADAALDWQVEPTGGTKVDLKLSNWEEIIDDATGASLAFPNSPGDELRGIFKISSIIDSVSAVTYWSDGHAGQELTGYFLGYLVKSITAIGGGQTQVDFSGGLAKIFIGSNAGSEVFDPTYGNSDPGAPIPHGDGYDDGELWLDLAAIGGVVQSDLTITLRSNFDSTTSPLNGSGIGFFDIVGGTGVSVFAPDAVDPAPGSGGTTGEQDLKFLSDVSDGTAGWPAKSSDPITGQIMPEPASAAVWGLLGICGIAGAARRRLFHQRKPQA